MLPPEITGVLSGMGYVLTPLDTFCGLKILNPQTAKKFWLFVHLGVENNAFSVRGDQPVSSCKDFKERLKRTIVAISAVMFAKNRSQIFVSGVQNSAAVHHLCEPLLISLQVQFVSVFAVQPSD